MADNVTYYYIRLKDNYFLEPNIQILEKMNDGYLYSNILLKMYLLSLKNNGKLILNNCIPYNPEMIATVTQHQIGTIERALEVFKQLKLVEVLDNGAIYMLDIQGLIGQSSTEADRKRIYRNTIDQEKKLIGQMSDKCRTDVGQMSDKSRHRLETKDITITKDRQTINQKPPKPKRDTIIKYSQTTYQTQIYVNDFYDYYNNQNWQCNGTPIKDWRKLFDIWVKNEKNKPSSMQRDYDFDQLERDIVDNF